MEDTEDTTGLDPEQSQLQQQGEKIHNNVASDKGYDSDSVQLNNGLTKDHNSGVRQSQLVLTRRAKLNF